MRVLSDPALPRTSAVPAARWRDLRTRVLSALVMAPVGLAALWLGGVAWLALLFAGGVGLAVEWRVMTAAMDPRPAWRGFGILYLGLPLLCLAWLRLRPGGLATMLFLVVLVSGCDIGAYLVGRLVGGPKLAPRISPGKTWSGAIGGLAAAVLLGCLVARGFGVPGPRLPAIAVAALLLGIVEELGDLLESALKRRCGVKDSGRLIPGHGGLLDRFDGLLAVAPAACLLALLPGAALPGIATNALSGGTAWW